MVDFNRFNKKKEENPVQKLMDLKAKYEKIKSQVAQKKGEQKAISDRLKKDFGLENESQADERLNVLYIEKEKTVGRLTKTLQIIEKIIPQEI